MQTAHYRAFWEQARLIAHCSLMPHARRHIAPTELLRFDWDKDAKENPPVAPATRTDFERIRERFGG